MTHTQMTSSPNHDGYRYKRQSIDQRLVYRLLYLRHYRVPVLVDGVGGAVGVGGHQVLKRRPRVEVAALEVILVFLLHTHGESYQSSHESQAGEMLENGFRRQASDWVEKQDFNCKELRN